MDLELKITPRRYYYSRQTYNGVFKNDVTKVCPISDPPPDCVTLSHKNDIPPVNITSQTAYPPPPHTTPAEGQNRMLYNTELVQDPNMQTIKLALVLHIYSVVEVLYS